MANKLMMKDVFRFDRPGTLERPGPIGRLVRLVLGTMCLLLVWRLAVYSDTADLRNSSLWILAIFGMLLVPYVVNIGFGVRWGGWPRVFSMLILIAGAVVSLIQTGDLLGAPLWLAITAWMLYVYGHLGLSFLLSAMLATPGCEMRAIPHLFGLMFRDRAREHYCPGFIDAIDKWEGNRHAEARSPGSDILGNAGRQLLFYGLPFLALQLAGNLAGFSLATGVPAAAFLFVGLVCVFNAWRCRRVHCFFLGPWCLLAGGMTALYSLRIIDFGPDSWSIIVNTGLAGAVLLYCVSEGLWGRYFGHKQP